MKLRASIARTRLLPLAVSLLAAIVVFWSTLSVSYKDQVRFNWHAKVVGFSEKLDQYSQSSIHTDPDHNLASTLSSILLQHAPGIPQQILKNNEIVDWPVEDDTELKDKLSFGTGDLLKMAEAHRGFVRAIRADLPEYVPPRHTRPCGIVTVGGSTYSPVLMVSLRLLRRTGTTLPIEVFIPDKGEYEYELCEEVLPRLNATCHVLSDLIQLRDESESRANDLKRYQYKIFAILFSSFSNVLWLDADNFPLRDASELFKYEPFTSTGLVTWPDLWATSISPAYYLVSSQSPVPVSQRASTESGQILVSKERHLHTLLLAAYYNFYGPSHYYTILNQGGAGRGDKSTFLPAAEAMGLPFYNVRQSPTPVGHKKASHPDSLWRMALIQHNPIEDYQLHHHHNRTFLPGGSKGSYETAKPYFLHMSTPKWDAYHVFDHVGEYDLTQDELQSPAAAYRDPLEAKAAIGGVERMVWEEVRWVGCEIGYTIRSWKGKTGICEKIKKYFEEVLDTRMGEKLGLGPLEGRAH